MNKVIIIAVVVIILVAIVAAGAFMFVTRIAPYLPRIGAPAGSVVGSGNVISETRTLDSFTSVDARFSDNLYITQSGTIDVRVEAEDNLLPLLRTYVTNGVLIIDWEKNVRTTKPVSVHLSMGDVEKLSNSGSGDVIGQTGMSTRLQAYCPNGHRNQTFRRVWTPLFPHLARTPIVDVGFQGRPAIPPFPTTRSRDC